LPGRGFNVKPMFITRIEDRNGNTLQSFTPVRREVISDVTAYSMIKMMQGVMQFGTGRRMWSYGVSGEIAGKTGTTNDNSDAWFMGYTPQLLCGAWVGCDDRFIRFKATEIGQGSSAALPIWAYFYEKVQNDRNIVGIDPGATFVKPDVMPNDINFDAIQGTTPALGAEGEDMGNGTSKDYEIPSNIKPEDIGAESQITPAETDKTTTKSAETKAPVNKPTTTPPAKLPDNKVQTQPATKPPTTPTSNQQPPKAVMPPRRP